MHGLEPGHSKTMMAAFIVAVRGTVAQAVLLGLCAALSHSLVVWLLAAWGTRHAHRHFGGRLETLARRAPWLSSALMALAGGVMIVQGLTHLSAG